jgi:5-methyltetrahydrofolate--homocysteine methyltransferase
MREEFANRKSDVQYLSLEQARENRLKLDWNDTTQISKPNFIGVKVFDDYSIEELSKYIDWSPFFSTWELNGTYPRIFEHKDYGAEAKKLFDDAQLMLKKIIAEKWLTAKAVFGIFEAKAEDEKVLILENGKQINEFHFLRQQTKKQSGSNKCLSDYISPNGDYIGAFAVTAGIGIEKKLAEFEKDHNDYESILLKALADRLAEAFAERLHERVRKEFWGYAADESLANEDLIREKYKGIRPAPGYAACPDHTEKPTIWKLLDAEKNTGIKLTESFAMYPTAAVSGFYFANPNASYFGVGKIQKDQVESIAKTRDISAGEMERWLRPNLGY